MRKTPRKCRPITMTPIPAAIDSAWLHCRSSAPNADAVAPKRDEHGREAGDEQERGDENVAAAPRLALVDQLLELAPAR